MRHARLILLGYLLAIATATPIAIGRAATPLPSAGEERFEAVEIYIDPLGKPLAAYQFQLTEADGRATIVGLENGQTAAFDEPPAYDRATIDVDGSDRVIAMAYSLLPADQLPTTRTRVTTVHVHITGDAPAQYRLDLIVAGDDQGQPIDATIDWQ